MGGGAGLSMNMRFRVVTEKAVCFSFLPRIRFRTPNENSFQSSK